MNNQSARSEIDRRSIANERARARAPALFPSSFGRVIMRAAQTQIDPIESAH